MWKRGVVLGLIFFLLIMQSVTLVYFRIRTTELSEEIAALNDKTNENQVQVQDQIEQLTINLMKTQEDLEDQLSEIKATTSADFSGIIERAVMSVVSVILDGAQSAKVLTYRQEIKDAILIGENPVMDVALLKIDGNYNVLEFGNSDILRVGEKVIAVGNPLGLSFSVTEGIISGLKRSLNNMPVYIQTDVPLNPGNSGGPLISRRGEVIGMNNFKVGEAEGLGFALESNAIVKAVNEISLNAFNQTLI